MFPPHPKTRALLERPQYVQRTPEWYEVRRELLTASDAASALDIKPFASFRGSSRAELLRKKVANEPVVGMNVMFGTRYEDEARDFAASVLGETIEEVGLVRHATLPWLGASPDGVTASGKLVEIKCPLKRAIVPGTVPEHYLPQVQVQMEVADVDSTLFVQYKPGAITPDGRPVLDVVVVERDRAWFERHRDALHSFWREYMHAKGLEGPRVSAPPPECLVIDDLYGEPPTKRLRA